MTIGTTADTGRDFGNAKMRNSSDILSNVAWLRPFSQQHSVERDFGGLRGGSHGTRHPRDGFHTEKSTVPLRYALLYVSVSHFTVLAVHEPPSVFDSREIEQSHLTTVGFLSVAQRSCTHVSDL